MKRLVLIRHAKSDWNNPEISDFDRPLNHRGLHDAPMMAELTKKLNMIPDLIITSSANRALSTAKIFARIFDIDNAQFKEDINIYRGNYLDYIKIITETENTHKCLFLFGHNPEISSTAAALVNHFQESVPTCAVICIDFDTDKWEEIEAVPGTLRYYEYPKKNKN